MSKWGIPYARALQLRFQNQTVYLQNADICDKLYGQPVEIEALTACGRTCFIGSRIADADAYRLDMDYMTGTDCSAMELKSGDTLAVYFETVRGSIYMQIEAPDKTILYSGNGKDVTEFTANVFLKEVPIRFM